VDELQTTTGVVALVAGGIALLALAAALVAVRRSGRLLAAQKDVLGDTGREDLVAHGVETRRRVDELGTSIETIAASLNERMAGVEGRLEGAVTRAGVLRYDAFNETSGRQSSSVALMDEHGDGVVLSAILQREQARVYAKPLRGGESELQLSPEEREAIRIAEENARA
jgi:hypothetical protein